MPGPLAGLKVIELSGQGPAPFCGMLLADMGAEVLRIARPGEPPATPSDVLARGRAGHLALDLKTGAGMAQLLPLIRNADALIEGFRPGVMERLGLSPAVCLAQNPRLVFGRVTGWGQNGPLAAIFMTRARDDWCRRFEAAGATDACLSPVLELGEVAHHPHKQLRAPLVETSGVLQPGRAPRLSRPGASAGPNLPAQTQPIS